MGIRCSWSRSTEHLHECFTPATFLHTFLPIRTPARMRYYLHPCTHSCQTDHLNECVTTRILHTFLPNRAPARMHSLAAFLHTFLPDSLSTCTDRSTAALLHTFLPVQKMAANNSVYEAQHQVQCRQQNLIRQEDSLNGSFYEAQEQV